MIVGSVNGVWADTLLKTIDFSDSSWTGMEFNQGNTTTADYNEANDVTFYSKSSSNQFSWANNELSYPNNNYSSGNYVLGFPVTGIVGGRITIKVYNGSTATRFKYGVKSGVTSFSTSDTGSGSSPSSDASPSSVEVTGLTDTKAFVYIGRYGSNDKYKKITRIEVWTPETETLLESEFYSFYKQSDSETVSSLLTAAELPSYITLNDLYSMPNNSVGNSSLVSSPHNFSTIDSSKRYYRLRTTASTKIVIGGLSRVKSIRLYGNGSSYDGTINISVSKLSGTGTAMNINSIDYENSQETVKEYSTGDLTTLDGYDIDTYYLYTITFVKKSSSLTNFSLWGLYIEAVPSSFTVSYDANGGSGSIDNSTGASITLSDGKGFEAPSANYTFAGWNTNEHGTGTSYTSGQSGVKADLNLYAVWTQSGTLDGNSGSDGTYTATYNKASIEITSPPAKAGYNLTGFYKADTGNDLVATSAGVLQTSATYTDAFGYWTNTSSAPTLYAQWENTHTVSVGVNSALMGSAAADDDELSEGETTTITAEAESGYKFRNWSVSDGDKGAELSSTTTNPTTLTMGSADVTVTANFSALEHYTITYNKGTNGSGDAIANGDKTEDVNFTLSSSTYNYTNHIQTGWATSDGGDKVYELGGTYTGNAHLNLYPSWREQYTITYDANGGSGSMSDTEDFGDITLTANAYTNSGYTFLGWATSQANADAGTVAYADKAEYTLSESTTLYAVWGENYCELKPATSGTVSYGNSVSMQSGAYGGVMTAVGSGLVHETNGLKFGNKADKPVVTLNDYLKEGSVITVTLKAGGNYARGLDVYSYDGKNKITTFSFPSDNNIDANPGNSVKTFQYTVTSSDILKDTNGFQLWRYSGNTWLQSLTVTDCQPGGVITASGWSTYSCNKKLDLSTISGGKAYVATGTEDGKVVVKSCTDIVDAREGLMIWGTPGAKFTINTTSETSNLSETNLMVGVPNGGSAPVGSYVFGWPTASENPTDDCGFYYVNSAAATLGNTKAYLNTAGSGARLTIVFEEEETTGVGNLTPALSEGEGAVYDLQGRKVAQPRKGLYIVNGKKVIIK